MILSVFIIKVQSSLPHWNGQMYHGYLSNYDILSYLDYRFFAFLRRGGSVSRPEHKGLCRLEEQKHPDQIPPKQHSGERKGFRLLLDIKEKHPFSVRGHFKTALRNSHF